MKLALLTLTITLTTITLFGQVIEKCDQVILLSTDHNIGHLTQNQMSDFLLTFGKECRYNVEYTEWSNELLFSVLDKQTELTLKTIEKEQKTIDLDEILSELSEPILDKVDLSELIIRIEKVDIDRELRSQILVRLKKAAGR